MHFKLLVRITLVLNSFVAPLLFTWVESMTFINLILNTVKLVGPHRLHLVGSTLGNTFHQP